MFRCPHYNRGEFSPQLYNTKTLIKLFVHYQYHPRRPRGSQSGAGEMARQKFSRTGGRTPGYQVSPDHFQTASRIPAPDWAEKIPCIILPNHFRVFLHGDCCPAIFIWLVHQNNACRAGKFQFDNPVHFKMLFTQKTNKSKGK